jgi:LVIVD repeat-containing protein
VRIERLLQLGLAGLVAACIACDDAGTGQEPTQSGSAGVVLVAAVSIPANYGIHDTFIRDGLAFVSAWNTGVMIFDVGNGKAGGSPSSPRLISTYATPGGEDHNAWWFWNPHTGERKYLFVGQEGPAGGLNTSSGDIHVLDVSDLAHPTEVAFFHLNGAGTHNFWMDEDAQILYAAYYNQGVVALDVSGSLLGDLSSRLIDSIRPGGVGDTYTWGVQLENGSLYAVDMRSGFWQLGLAGGTLSVIAGGDNVPERYSSDLAVANGFAYTGTWGSGRTLGVVGNAVKIWRLDASGAPTLADSIITTGIGTVSDIKVSPDGKLLMFTAERGANAGFWFYSLQNPAKPTYVGKYLVGSGVHTGKFATIGGRLYAFGAQDPNPSTLLILDVTAIDQ